MVVSAWVVIAKVSIYTPFLTAVEASRILTTFGTVTSEMALTSAAFHCISKREIKVLATYLRQLLSSSLALPEERGSKSPPPQPSWVLGLTFSSAWKPTSRQFLLV
mgnify:CR=1 FL=1